MTGVGGVRGNGSLCRHLAANPRSSEDFLIKHYAGQVWRCVGEV